MRIACQRHRLSLSLPRRRPKSPGQPSPLTIMVSHASLPVNVNGAVFNRRVDKRIAAMHGNTMLTRQTLANDKRAKG
jgi:hypothetical protein